MRPRDSDAEVAGADDCPEQAVRRGSDESDARVTHTKRRSCGAELPPATAAEAERHSGGGGRSCCLCCWRCCKCNSPAPKKHDDTDRYLLDLCRNIECNPPSLEQIRCWGESFDMLITCPVGRRVFKEFLRCEYSEENILFYIACEELKKEHEPSVVEQKVKTIYEDFISILSPREVSLDSRVRDVVNSKMHSPSVHTFDEAQLQIYTLMHRDSYPRFVCSPMYRRLARLGHTDTRKNSSAAT